ncbi:2'-5' RNA ligase family protein [Sorangium sp. So ce1024]|uniref:2'-5' RNA ligase family protein n=1 Tax=unclassified Sorangium TaxID=2621164 RepID=UPI003F11B6F8
MEQEHESAFALWLVPGEAPRARLRALIEALARETGGPAFTPHLTLLGGLRGDGGELAAKLRRLGGERCPGGPVALAARGPATGSTYHQCVFLDVAPAAPLLALRRAAEAAFSAPETLLRPFRPHVSLVYGDLPADRRAALAADPRVLALARETWSAERLELWDVGGETDRWRCVDAIALASP